ncbi:MAG TPA: carboxypeptidase regulatory-like domain-containing protein [Candidatus Angelobacter sp.]|jgi:tetratricopeptide (TPR) repeat protein|nr:carboxypeptidase regulatory-like domain-containing protein [Candidatus Angelobacter sp.]
MNSTVNLTKLKTQLTYAVMAIVILMLGATVAWSQATAAKVQGKVTNGGKPLASAEVVLTNTDNGKTYKMKTDKDGTFSAVGIMYGTYQEEVSDLSGEKLFKTKVAVTGEGGAVQDLSVEVATGKGGAPPPPSAEEQAKRAKNLNLNTLINQYNAAQGQKNWQQASDILKQMITVEPNRWEYQQSLGAMQFNLNQYQDAIDTYEKVIPLAENASKTDPKADPVKTKAAIAQMYDVEGKAYGKLKKNPEGIAALNKSIELDPNPNTYLDLCVAQSNGGDAKGAAASCQKVIQTDPNRADAYYVEAISLIGMSDGKLDAQGHYIAPPGTTEALNKYLELAPDGPHAAEVKQIMDQLGAKIETNYKDKKKK